MSKWTWSAEVRGMHGQRPTRTRVEKVKDRAYRKHGIEVVHTQWEGVCRFRFTFDQFSDLAKVMLLIENIVDVERVVSTAVEAD